MDEKKKWTRREVLKGAGVLGGVLLAGAAGVRIYNGLKGEGGTGTEAVGNQGAATGQGSGKKPNVMIILADDMGFSDVGCYGGIIETPNIDKLAANGIRLTQFSNTARCSPSRASLLTGLHPHQAGMAHLQGEYGPYTKELNKQCVTIAEVLKENGYGTYMSGKWHVGSSPHLRGFERSFHYPGGGYFAPRGIQYNGTNLPKSAFPKGYFSTDDMTDRSISMIEDHLKSTPEKPFFLYMAYTAPHFPLQAKAKDIAKYKGRFDKGWDVLREEKYDKMKKLGLIEPEWELSPLSASGTYSWEEEPHKEWRLRAMEVYAAMVDCLDQNVGKLVSALEKNGQLDNTMIIFLSDNGGNAEFLNIIDPSKLPGGSGYDVKNGHYGAGWASLSNTPFRMYKHYIHEGGIAAPFIVHWPAGLKEKGVLRKKPAQLPDILATILDVSGAKYPEEYNGSKIIPLEGVSVMSILQSDNSNKDYLYWEHEGNCGIRHENWMLVKFYNYPWELYDMAKDGTEMHDLAAEHPDIVKQLNEEYVKWTKRANVLTKTEYSKYLKKGQKPPTGPIDIRKIKGAPKSQPNA